MSNITSWEIDDIRLRVAIDKRQRCLESNNFTCNNCNTKSERGFLYTVPDKDRCICKACWLSGIR